MAESPDGVSRPDVRVALLTDDGALILHELEYQIHRVT